MTLAAMRLFVLAATGAALLSALAGCSGLPPPYVVDEAPGLARVAELLKAPPLRPVPESIAELRPPYPCGDNLYLTMQFAPMAGVVYFAGRERYAVLDIATGEVIADGAGLPLGQLSANGRVMTVPVTGGVELRNTETGEVLVTLPGATGDEFSWVGDSGITHVAPPSGLSSKPRIVYLDLATGLESSLATVSERPSKYIFDFGVLMGPGNRGGYLHARERLHELTLTSEPSGIVGTLGDSRPVDAVNPGRGALLPEGRVMLLKEEAFAICEISTFACLPVELPGFFPTNYVRTAEPDRFLVRGYFKDENRQPLKRDGEIVWHDFYYSVSRNSLAPVELEVNVSKLTYVASTRSHVLAGESSFRPYALPAGREEGKVAEVLSAARNDALASHGQAR
jgi:hypothetical protein